ncbi:PIN domain-like protein [Wolfiporia cocos MD-104 SS10]|uniref:PIN domain-like protein n=1 Tax=Wolfiporia cocos (strain MD-104) TaxID=742152 RepID=A0A2H3J0J4_WOLCO|nr:PIN domain-like protein [Wolfiporia cocos MD-104 SS10]
MGVRNFTDCIRKVCPHAIKVLPDRFKALSGKTVVIDGTLVTQRFHFAPVPSDYRHILGWYRMVIALRDCGVRTICVFDGKQRSIAKELELDRRRQVRQVSCARGAIENKRFDRLRELSTLFAAMDQLAKADKQKVVEAARAVMSGSSPGDKAGHSNELVSNALDEDIVPLRNPDIEVAREPTLPAVDTGHTEGIPASLPESDVQQVASPHTSLDELPSIEGQVSTAQDAKPSVTAEVIAPTSEVAPTDNSEMLGPLDSMKQNIFVNETVSSLETEAPDGEMTYNESQLGPAQGDKHLTVNDPVASVLEAVTNTRRELDSTTADTPLEEPIPLSAVEELSQGLLSTHPSSAHPSSAHPSSAHLQSLPGESHTSSLHLSLERSLPESLASLYCQYNQSMQNLQTLSVAASTGVSRTLLKPEIVNSESPGPKLQEAAIVTTGPDLSQGQVVSLEIGQGADVVMSKTQYQLALDEGEFWESLSDANSNEFDEEVVARIDTMVEKSSSMAESYNRRNDLPTTETYAQSKEFLRAMGIPVIEVQGPYEAEALASSLVLNGYADYVASEDTDVLVYEAPLIRNITAREPLLMISGTDVRAGLQLDRANFVDFALLLGTDFSQRIKGIGPRRALDFMRTYGSIERILECETRYPPPDPPHSYLAQINLAREVFSTLPPVPKVEQLQTKEYDEESVSALLTQYGLQNLLTGEWDSTAALAGNYFDDDPTAFQPTSAA